MPELDLRHPTVISHGADVVYRRYGEIIDKAEPVQVAMIDGGLDTNSQHFTVVDYLAVPGDEPSYPGHANQQAMFTALFAPHKIHLIDVDNPGGGMGPNWAVGELILPYEGRIDAIHAPYHMTNSYGMERQCGELAKRNAIWAASCHSSTHVPGCLLTYPDHPDNILVGYTYDANGRLLAYRWDSVPGLAVLAPHSSATSGVVASAFCLMRLLRPDLGYRNIMAVLRSTADTEKYDWLRLDRAADLLMGNDTVEPVPTPEPDPVEPEPPAEPTPEEPTMIVAENEYVRISVPEGLTNEANGEGLANMLRDDQSKTLFWDSAPKMEWRIKQDCRLVAYRTANDAPARDIHIIQVDGSAFALEKVDVRHTSVETGIQFLAETVYSVAFYSFGPDPWGKNLTQLEYLKFEPLATEEPEPEPDPDPEPTPQPRAVSMTVHYEDGSTKEVTL